MGVDVIQIVLPIWPIRANVMFFLFSLDIKGSVYEFFEQYFNLVQGDRYFLTTSDLTATDGTAQFGNVVFTIQSPPRSGYFAFVNHIEQQISSFTQGGLIKLY